MVCDKCGIELVVQHDDSLCNDCHDLYAAPDAQSQQDWDDIYALEGGEIDPSGGYEYDDEDIPDDYLEDMMNGDGMEYDDPFAYDE